MWLGGFHWMQWCQLWLFFSNFQDYFDLLKLILVEFEIHVGILFSRTSKFRDMREMFVNENECGTEISCNRLCFWYKKFVTLSVEHCKDLIET